MNSANMVTVVTLPTYEAVPVSGENIWLIFTEGAEPPDIDAPELPTVIRRYVSSTIDATEMRSRFETSLRANGNLTRDGWYAATVQMLDHIAAVNGYLATSAASPQYPAPTV